MHIVYKDAIQLAYLILCFDFNSEQLNIHSNESHAPKKG